MRAENNASLNCDMSIMKKKIATCLLIAGALIAAILACGSPTQLATMNLRQADVDKILSQSASEFAGANWSFDYQGLELGIDLMRVHGLFKDQAGPAVNGYIDMNLSVADGELDSALLSANFGDLHPPQSDLQQLIGQIEQAIGKAVEGDRQSVQFIEVTLAQDLLKVQIRFLP